MRVINRAMVNIQNVHCSVSSVNHSLLEQYTISATLLACIPTGTKTRTRDPES